MSSAQTPREEIHIETEDEAWELYRKLVDGDIEFASVPQISFGDWAKLDVYIPSKRYDSAITPYMMNGWIELQRAVYRAFAVSHGGEAAANRLSELEKDRLELVVEIRSGSSDQSVDLQAILETVASSLVDKMGPNEILIAVMTLILTIGGRSVVVSWLNNRKEEKLAEIELLKTKEVQKAHITALESVVAAAKIDHERAHLIAKAADLVPMVADVQHEVDKGREALVKHVTKVDAVVNGVPIKSEAGQSLTTRTRVEAAEVRLDGLYKVRKVDTTIATGYRVHLVDQVGTEIVADVGELLTTLADREVIRDAEWSKVPVYLQINGKKRRGEVTDAAIIRARPYDPDTDGDWR